MMRPSKQSRTSRYESRTVSRARVAAVSALLWASSFSSDSSSTWSAGPLIGAHAITIYQEPSATASGSSSGAVPTGSFPPFDDTTLTAPSPPSPPQTSLDVTLPITADALVASGQELSVKQRGNFLGFSVELSVANSVLGSTGNRIEAPFLNYMANIKARAGQGAIVRVGGNTQESSTYFESGFSNGQVIQKISRDAATGNPLATPVINYSPQLFYAMANISRLVDVHWYFGLAFNETDVQTPSPNIPIAAEAATSILGDRLLGLQVGNEPDLYVDHSTRPAGWNVTNYLQEFDSVISNVLSTDKLTNKAIFVGPGICCDQPGFELQDVYDAGFLTQNADDLAIVAVQHYPANNCGINGNVINPQDIFEEFLNHTSAVALTQPYLAATPETLAAGKEIMMFEFNSASCGGFPGLSDSFGAALWMTDYALQMAYRNFTSALMHVGGQSTWYNPFTPPKYTLPNSYKWTTGSVYYSTLVIAEAFGSSNLSQVVDLNVATNGSIYAPVYGIYENGAPTRLVLFNYVSDSSGASTLDVQVNFGGSAPPQSTVSVKYLTAPDVAEKYNISWAGQTLGGSFEGDGTLFGSENTLTINCDTTGNTCTIPVYAPSIAVVFLTDQALKNSGAHTTTTFTSTIIQQGSATFAPGAMSTSNGQSGSGGGSTSSGSVPSSGLQSAVVSWLTLGVAAGVSLFAVSRSR